MLTRYALCAVALTAFLAGCGAKAADYYTLQPVDINYSILASCAVSEPKPLDMTLSAGGRVSRVAVGDGQRVRSGQLLVQLDNFTERQNLDIARKNLSATQLKLTNAVREQLPKLREQKNQAQANLDKARLDLDRANELFASNVIARVELEGAQNRYQSALSAFNQVKITLDSYESSGPVAELSQQISVQKTQVELAQQAVEDRRIVSPYDAVVSRVAVQNGQTLSAGSTVATVIEQKPWVMEAEVDQKELPFLATNMTALISFDAYPQDRVRADITYVCTLVDAQKGTCNLKFRIRDAKPYIKFGMTGTVEVSAGTYRQKLAVPSRFVDKNGGPGVWIWTDAGAERIPLRDYDVIGEQWVVVKELKAGSKILLPAPGMGPKVKLGKEVKSGSAGK